ncbi:unnamed protein product [Chrysoparadoxa australica]
MPPSEIKTHIFDLDGTLYAADDGYIAHVKENVFRYLEEKLGIEDGKAYWHKVFPKYNQTLRALQAEGHNIDVAEYWQYIRAGQADFLMEAGEPLKEFLTSLPQDKYVFTNCAEKEAEVRLWEVNALTLLDGVYGSDFMGQVCKPEAEAFRIVCQDIGADPSTTAMYEDSYKNLVTANSLGMTTIFVTGELLRVSRKGEE